MHFPRKPFLFLALASATAFGQTTNDATNDSVNDSSDKVAEQAPAPLIKWTFDKDEPGAWQGGKSITPTGPQTPTFPGFKAGNKAAVFSGSGTSINVRESDVPGVNLRFVKGDAITLEAWVSVEQIKNGSYCYLVSKGRNKKAAFSTENQNYALRLKGEGGEARPSFLFRSESDKPDGTREYHRWVAEEGFTPGTGWHHVVVSYTFGKADSLEAYVDGKEVKGVWDMAGKTNNGPVNDADDLNIGSGYGGGAGNSLQGSLDEVAIYRGTLPESVVAQRFQYVPQPPVVERSMIPDGKVLVQICEDRLPEKNAWPTQSPRATESYGERAFGLFEVPHKYITSGVRADRPIPFLVRAAAVVNLPAGKHRILLRGRGASHLHIDGVQLLTTTFPKPDSGGHGHVGEQEGYLNLGPDFRFAPPGTQETWCEFESKGGEHTVVLETLVGGMVGKSKRRPELGETVVAWSKQGTETWQLLTPAKGGKAGEAITYNDQGWTTYAADRQARLDEMNSQRRAERLAETKPYWDNRRKAVQDWLASTKEVAVPPLVKGYPALNPIDHFLSVKMATVSEQNTASHSGKVDFYRDIQPILETKCYDCHQGTKTKGDLKLDSLAAAMHGGENDGPAVTPLHPEESSLLARVITDDEDAIMPPKGSRLTKEQTDLITLWINEGAVWPEMKVDKITVTALTSDLAFLRRAYLDTVGVPPTLAEIEAFQKDTSADKRIRAIDKLLTDPRWADNWTGYWQDVLAENPNILNPTLNNSGPFRWWIYEALLDNKPMDLFVTELLTMKGSVRFGGPAGFGVASQNDVPMAAKGTIVSTAFLGVETKCARCHDSPSHESLQEDLFALAAMLSQKPVDVPTTSSVPMDKLHEGGRKPLIQVTLKPGSKVQPKWRFTKFGDEASGAALAEHPEDTREQLAAIITGPQNERFAQVMANRLWARLMGRGIVEPVEDWEKGKPTHPELLQWLGREFVRNGYDAKKLVRLIMTSHAYQRATDDTLRTASPLFASPAPRRLEAEQIVDSLFAATGKPFNLEEVSLDIDGRRDLGNSISLGHPRRSWMLTSTSNERDRPSLALPRNQAVCDVLGAFGWRGSRQDPVSKRDRESNVLQPAIISNGTVGIWLTRLSDDHGITALALEDRPVDQFVDTLFLKLLTRMPTAEEKQRYTEFLGAGYADRKLSPVPVATPAPRVKPMYVSWSNHLDPVATTVRMAEETAARKGDPPTQKLDAAWRQKLEDALWALLNAPEWVFVP
ncbi:DUF1553 domain-containing protein [Verrucomicrobium spinosum]|uniref:DUF1553 domain-containing protein n=2 Tax=Verrucomicrobium spinosum TaxID=2736 RepID=UPI00017468E0|nr:DUF1553 domain-containing protein [Verrucomicrobium spinosum]